MQQTYHLDHKLRPRSSSAEGDQRDEEEEEEKEGWNALDRGNKVSNPRAKLEHCSERTIRGDWLAGRASPSTVNGWFTVSARE